MLLDGTHNCCTPEKHDNGQDDDGYLDTDGLTENPPVQRQDRELDEHDDTGVSELGSEEADEEIFQHIGPGFRERFDVSSQASWYPYSICHWMDSVGWLCMSRQKEVSHQSTVPERPIAHS